MHRAIRIAFFFALDDCILYAAINKGLEKGCKPTTGLSEGCQRESVSAAYRGTGPILKQAKTEYSKLQRPLDVGLPALMKALSPGRGVVRGSKPGR